jgi:hypothetical protein
MSLFTRILASILFSSAFAAGASAQCPPFLQKFDPNEILPGVVGKVLCSTMWDPDGPGPRTPVLVVGGEFLVAGDLSTANIAAFDPATREWTGFGPGLGFFPGPFTQARGGAVHALCVLPSGALVAGGYFDSAHSYPPDPLPVTLTSAMKWDAAASTWRPLGVFDGEPGIPAIVRSFSVSNSVLYVGGDFAGVNGNGGRCIARWFGELYPLLPNPWSTYGHGFVAGDSVRALLLPDPYWLVAGGKFASGHGLMRLADFDLGWQGFGNLTGTVDAIYRYDASNMLVAGDFETSGPSPVNGVGICDVFGNWTRLGNGISGSTVHAVSSLTDGSIVAAGNFSSAGGVPASGIARWNGTAWSALGAGVNRLNEYKEVYTIARSSDTDIFFGGDFKKVGEATANNLARWNGTEMTCTGSTIETGGPVVYALAREILGAPGTQSIFVGGEFSNVAGTIATNIIRLDLTYISPLGWVSSRNQLAGGTNGPVYALAKLGGAAPTFQVVAAGNFTSAGGIGAQNIAIWNGSSWQALGSGLNGPVYALIAGGPNYIIAAGDFSSAGGVSVQNIALWNGSAWSALGNSGTNGPIRSLAGSLLNGMYVGGSFTRAGGLPVNRFAYWNGTQWGAPSPSPWVTSEVRSMAYRFGPEQVPEQLVLSTPVRGRLPLYIENSDSWIGATHYYELGSSVPFSGPFSEVSMQALGPSNDLFAFGGHVVQWKDTSIDISGSNVYLRVKGPPFASYGGTVHALDIQANFPEDILAAGDFPSGAARTQIGGSESSIDFGAGLTNAGETVDKVFRLPNGDLLATGNFASIGGVRVNRIARWNGSAWSALGNGLAGQLESVNTFLGLPNGDVLAAGFFSSIGGVAADRIARWNGSSWSPFGACPVGSTPTCLIERPDGTLVLGGGNSAGVRTWNGATWEASQMSSTCPISNPIDMANAQSGDLIVMGRSTVASYKVARWSGPITSATYNWSVLGGEMNGKLNALAVLPNGDIVVGGEFTTAGGVPVNRIARWNGAAWSAMGAGFARPVRALRVLSNGQLVATCDYAASGPNQYGLFAKWTGSSWATLAETTGTATSIAELPNGDVILGGSFYDLNLQGVNAESLLRYSSSGANVAITSQPTGSTICDSIAASVSVAAASNATMTYQWQVQTTPGTWVNVYVTNLPGGGQVSVASPLSATTQVSITRTPGVSQYQFRCLVSNSCSTLASNPVTIKLCLADQDCNLFVDDSDFVEFAGAYDTFLCDDPSMPPGCHADLNGDGYVDDADFVQFATAYDQFECQ